MFTWVCPRCGGSVDVAKDVCPHCAARASAASSKASGIQQALPVEAALPSEPTPAEAAPAESTTADKPASEVVPGSRAKAPAAPNSAFNLNPRHLLIFAGALLVAILGAVWLAGGGIFSGLRFEDPNEMAESPVETFAIGVRGPIEVSGIRPYYDDEFQTHVRAFVANHSQQPQSVALSVLLRVRQASQQAPPLATFRVIVTDPLPPAGGQEIDVSLAAMGSLQSLPPWDEIRVDLELLGAQGD